MEDCLKILISIFAISVFLIAGCFVLAESIDTGVSLQVISTTTPSVCDNDGTCDPGEDTSNCPFDCPAARPGGGGVVIFDTIPPIIEKLLVSRIAPDSAQVSWETNEPAFCSFFWGLTQDYEKEVAMENVFYLQHEILVRNLSPSTKYHFKISCQDNSGNKSEIKDQELITLSPIDISPPSNISNFKAISDEGKLELKWTNPFDPDFKSVVIVRSTDFYPSDPFIGVPVYTGSGQYFMDTGLTDGTRYYYTAFAYDLAGNYSSGAVVSGVPAKPGDIIPPEIIVPASTTPETEKLTIDDFDFIQDGIKVVPIGGKFNFKAGVPLTAAISYEKVPEILKTIMVTLKRNEEKFSFLLRINKEKTRYEATILAPEPGVYPLIMSILNYKNQSLKTINGELVIGGTGPPQAQVPWYKQINWLYVILSLLAFALLIIFIRKKEKKAQEPENLLYSKQ